LAYAPYADLLWLETKKPDLEQARYFANVIRKENPGKYENDLSAVRPSLIDRLQVAGV